MPNAGQQGHRSTWTPGSLRPKFWIWRESTHTSWTRPSRNSRQEAAHGSETLQRRASLIYNLEEHKSTRQTRRERTVAKVWDQKHDLLSTSEAPWGPASSSVKEDIHNPDPVGSWRGVSEDILHGRSWWRVRHGGDTTQPSFRCQALGGCELGTEPSLGPGGELLTLTLLSQNCSQGSLLGEFPWLV